MCNMDIRQEAKAAGVKLWEVSYALGIMSDTNFSRKLRRELPLEEKQRIREIIKQLVTERGNV